MKRLRQNCNSEQEEKHGPDKHHLTGHLRIYKNLLPGIEAVHGRFFYTDFLYYRKRLSFKNHFKK